MIEIIVDLLLTTKVIFQKLLKHKEHKTSLFVFVRKLFISEIVREGGSFKTKMRAG